MGLCASLPIRAEHRENTGKLVESVDADLGLPKRHACAVALIEHPIRQLAGKVRPFVRVDAGQFLAATKRRDLQRPPEQWMPTIGDRRKAKTVCRMSVVGPAGRGTRTDGVSVMTLHRWRKRHTEPNPTSLEQNEIARFERELGSDQRIAELQAENARLRRLVTDLLLENAKLAEAAKRDRPPRDETRKK
jgi:hypothetical protein